MPLTVLAARKNTSQPPTDGAVKARRKTLRCDGNARSNITDHGRSICYFLASVHPFYDGVMDIAAVTRRLSIL